MAVIKQKIAVLYSLARSGGTIISRCLGCIPGNVLLSEVHPRYSFYHPLVQARDWFDLITEDELIELKSVQRIPYLDSIRLISERCRERGLNLIIRDWTHIDFITSPYPAQPTYRLSQYDLLEEHFDVKHIAIVRDPIDSFLSLTRLEEFRGKLSLAVFMKEYLRYAERVAEIGFIRYEDFCESPGPIVQRICQALNVSYDERFMEWFQSYTKITGDVFKPRNKRGLAGDRAGERAQNEIRRPPRRSEHVAIMDQLEGNDDFRAIQIGLGYSLAPDGIG